MVAHFARHEAVQGIKDQGQNDSAKDSRIERGKDVQDLKKDEEKDRKKEETKKLLARKDLLSTEVKTLTTNIATLTVLLGGAIDQIAQLEARVRELERRPSGGKFSKN